MSQVVTYQLAYISTRECNLCDACTTAGDHGCGTLGPVTHGRHRGTCDGAAHDQREEELEATE